MLVDQATVRVCAGDGGDGRISFRRERFIPRGGPDGGDGGRGGHVFFVASARSNTLLQFRTQRVFKAAHGEHGQSRNRHGRQGADLHIEVPVGTVLRDLLTDEVLADMVRDKQSLRVAEGGAGGLGNTHFKSSTLRAPYVTAPKGHGQDRHLALELQLLADVAIIGLPNAGKSSLLAALSAAQPRVAHYPFTTIRPQLGTLTFDNFQQLVLADIPGLIAGASQGRGLGHQFLRHIRRARLLLHLIDPTPHADDLAALRADYASIRQECAHFDPQLATAETWVCLTKQDLPDAVAARQFEADIAATALPCFAISTHSGQGLDALRAALHAWRSAHGALATELATRHAPLRSRATVARADTPMPSIDESRWFDHD